MIDVEIEKNLHLNAQDRYDIISMAMDAADDNGFINSFIFERALFVYSAIMLYPEGKNELSEAAALDLLKTGDLLIDKGLLKKMNIDYALDVNTLMDEAEIWYAEYENWAHSARGILDTVQMFTGNFVENAGKRLQEYSEESKISELIDVAHDGGMDRDIGKNLSEPQIEKEMPEIKIVEKENISENTPEDSLFE